LSVAVARFFGEILSNTESDDLVVRAAALYNSRSRVILSVPAPELLMDRPLAYP
jgi:hypothetical protein